MRTAAEDLYERDFYAWTQRQAKELRRWADARPNLELDLAHVAEEIADLGKEQRNALRSWTTRIIEHLLLLEHSPATEPHRHWTHEVIHFRREVTDRLTKTLRADLSRRLPLLYERAKQDLATEFERFGETEVLARLPPACPYTLPQVIEDWWPD